MRKFIVIISMNSYAFGQSNARHQDGLAARSARSYQSPKLSEQLSEAESDKKVAVDIQGSKNQLFVSGSGSVAVGESHQKLALNLREKTEHRLDGQSPVSKSKIGDLAVNDSLISKPSSSSEEISIPKRNQAKIPTSPQERVLSSNTSASGATVIKDVTKEVTIREILETNSDYHFSTFGRDDPFLPSVKEINESKQNFKEGAPVTSILQENDLKDLKLVGVWKASSGEPKAMISVPKGGGVVVQVGDLVGKKGGRILDILEDRLLIREFVVTFDGTRQFEDRQMLIQSKISTENAAVSDSINTNLNSMGLGGQSTPTPTPSPSAVSKASPAQPVSVPKVPVSSGSNSQIGNGSPQKLLYDYKSISDQGSGGKFGGPKPFNNK